MAMAAWRGEGRGGGGGGGIRERRMGDGEEGGEG